MAEKLVQHRHCQKCLKAIPLGEEYCNDECKDQWNLMIKANRRKNIMTMIWMAISVFVLVFILAYSYN